MGAAPRLQGRCWVSFWPHRLPSCVAKMGLRGLWLVGDYGQGNRGIGMSSEIRLCPIASPSLKQRLGLADFVSHGQTELLDQRHDGLGVILVGTYFGVSF